MILICTPNPSLDRTTVVAGFALGRIFRVDQPLGLAGGKGFNVARVLRALGEEVVVVGPFGGRAGEAVLDQAHAEGIVVDSVAVAGETRTCTSIVDRDARQVTELYERGPALDSGAWDLVADHVDRRLASASLLLVCGSVPDGVPEDGLSRLVDMAANHDVPAWIDGHGPHLVHALGRNPGLVKVNGEEAEGITGLGVAGVDDALAAAGAIRSLGATSAVVTLGREGAAGIDGRGVRFGWAPPDVDAVSAVGSGDALFAGIAAGVVRDEALAEATRRGVALGAANTLRLGAGILDPAAAEELLPRVVRLV